MDGSFLVFSTMAQSSEYGEPISCRIYVDGQLVKRSESTGPYSASPAPPRPLT